jgi:hypothetical protein
MTNFDTSDAIAFGAVIISLFALGISLFEILQNRPKLRVVVSSSATYPDGHGVLHVDRPREFRVGELDADAIEMVSVEVTNFGRQPTMIKGLSFQPKKSTKSVNPVPGLAAENVGDTLPVEIAPGQFRKFFFDAMFEVKFPEEATGRTFKSFVFAERPDLLVRHSWDRKPFKVRNLQR